MKKTYDAIVLGYYRKFVGSNEVDDLIKRFDVNNFFGTWNQVYTSRSTGLFGTGIKKRNVMAVYGADLKIPGNVSVYNTALNPDGKRIEIYGTSRSRNGVATCRTVSFPTVNAPEGDYWIIYLSNDLQTIIVASPLIISNLKLSSNFALYVLTKKSGEDFFKDSVEVDKVQKVLKKYGFKRWWNRAIITL
jgi:lipocalin